jgi:hypothetical protein
MTLNNAGSNQLMEMMSQFAGAINPLERNGRSQSNQETEQIQCSGLNMISDRHYAWTVPHGGPVSETYCKHCAEEFNIKGSYRKSAKSTYCHGYLKTRNADNGIFNVSFWATDLKKCYDTETTEMNNMFCVRVPSGGNFSMLLNSTNPKKQYFRYELAIIDSDQQEHLIIPESKSYCEKSCMVIHKSKSLTGAKFVYIDNSDPKWNIITTKERLQYCILRPGDVLIVKFHIYDVIPHQFDDDSRRDYGKYKLTTNQSIVSCSTTQLDRHQDMFFNTPSKVLPTLEHVRFTLKPMIMKFYFETNTSMPDTSHVTLDKVLKRKINDLNTIISVAESTCDKCSAESLSYRQKMETLTKEITLNKELRINMKAVQQQRTDEKNDHELKLSNESEPGPEPEPEPSSSDDEE